MHASVSLAAAHWSREMNVELELVFRKQIGRRIYAIHNRRGGSILLGDFKGGGEGPARRLKLGAVPQSRLEWKARRENQQAGLDSVRSKKRRHRRIGRDINKKAFR